jgi:hypothetical protein
MSAFPLEADAYSCPGDVGFVPIVLQKSAVVPGLPPGDLYER